MDSSKIWKTGVHRRTYAPQKGSQFRWVDQFTACSNNEPPMMSKHSNSSVHLKQVPMKGPCGRKARRASSSWRGDLSFLRENSHLCTSTKRMWVKYMSLSSVYKCLVVSPVIPAQLFCYLEKRRKWLLSEAWCGGHWQTLSLPSYPFCLSLSLVS